MINEADKLTQMIECQVRPFYVTDPDVIAALFSLSRAAFIEDDSLKDKAYLDIDIPINDSDPPRMMLAPATLARLLQEGALSEGDDALVVGCGLGYTVVLLGLLGLNPEGLESHKSMVDRAPRAFEAAGVKNWPVHHGSIEAGLPDRLFDLVLIEGAVQKIPDALLANVAPGGKLIAFDISDGVSQAVCLRNIDGVFNRMALFEAPAPVLPGFDADDKFVF